MSRLRQQFDEVATPALIEQFGYKNKMQVPKLKKIVINAGVGETVTNSKAIEYAVYSLTQISGQKPVVRKSKKAVANFKLREGLAIGCSVTMRGEQMYHFLDRLVTVALPRVRDFKGIPRKGFDGRGNYTMGIREEIVFPEIDIDKLDKIRGFNISFVTSARSDEEGLALLSLMGMPFRQ